MAKGGSGGIVKHPVVTDINFVDPYMSTSEKEEWLKQNSSKKLTDKEASATIKAAEHYSLSGYHSIHWGNSPDETAKIDSMIEDPKAPVYGKNSYRGIMVTTSSLATHGVTVSAKDWVMNIINSGVWKEPGVSSFSATKSTAMSFGHFGSSNPVNQDKIHILITNKGHTKGMPFKHISECTSENEILQSSKTMKSGMKIIGWHTNKAGNEFFIDVDDSL